MRFRKAITCQAMKFEYFGCVSCQISFWSLAQAKEKTCEFRDKLGALFIWGGINYCFPSSYYSWIFKISENMSRANVRMVSMMCSSLSIAVMADQSREDCRKFWAIVDKRNKKVYKLQCEKVKM